MALKLGNTKKSSKGASASAGASGRSAKKGDEPDLDEAVKALPDALARSYAKSKIDAAEKQLEEHGLVAPTDYEGDWPELPDDIETTDYGELSNLLLQFQNAVSTAIWQQSYHYIWHDTFKEIAEYASNRAVQDAEGSNAEQRKASAAMNDLVVLFRAKEREHYRSYVRMRDLGVTLQGKIKAVSRVLGFKDEDEEVNNLSPKKSTSRRSRSK